MLTFRFWFFCRSDALHPILRRRLRRPHRSAFGACILQRLFGGDLTLRRQLLVHLALERFHAGGALGFEALRLSGALGFTRLQLLLDSERFTLGSNRRWRCCLPLGNHIERGFH